MKELTVHSWDELQKVIFDGVWDPAIHRYRNNCVFRGMGDSEWGLTPSLNRACAHDMSLEKQLIRALKKYGFADLPQNASVWQLLVIGQHFGLPTRLLDWTYSPLVAAHFATDDLKMYDRDGVIYRADLDQLNRLLPNLLKKHLAQERVNVFSMEALDRFGENLEGLAALEQNGNPFVLFFEPSSMVDRIANQYGLFSLTSRASVSLDSVPGADSCLMRILLPAQIKLEIRDKLDYVNISERMIYPGLDGICKWIARRYAALGPKYHHAGTDKAERKE